MDNFVALIPLVLFLAVALGISFVARRRSVGEGGFVKEYFIGNRTLGGFVLAMTTIATYGSVSSFVGGPGQAWLVGWGWVYMAVVQVTALVLLYGIMGKKLALVARKLDAVTVIDVVRARYNSNALANISAVIVVLFFAATMVAQFVGGAKLFEAVTGYSYMVGLVLFGAAVILFTTIGGFRGVAFTDALCGIIMLVGIGVLAAGILTAGGGYGNIMETIKANHPAMLEPFSGGSMPATLYFTQWLLVGVFTFVLPQSMVRCMGFKDTKALHGAMITGTVIIGLMMIGVTALGVLSAGVLTGSLADYGSSVDNIIPRAIAQTLPSWAAGVAIIGPIAASISTVS
ncbi:sodium/pantothenate symporter, partial [Senegalimassilia anaerobia]|uniref:sodium/pantothenate symporter n=1 Tax=Senegalimassilia anaerobia TaxID=1473216 RepID=UPI003A979C44